MPALPPEGDPTWYDWATGVHNRVVAVPQGGTSGQALVKNSGTDFDTSWGTVGGSSVTLANLPAGATFRVVQNGDGTWPNRLSSRTDLMCFWVKIVAASSDPAAATSPSLTGAYTNDLVVGV